MSEQPLAALVAAMARRLAGVLLANCSTASGAPETATFLSCWADTADPLGNPEPNPEANIVPTDRAASRLGSLVRRYGLSAVEQDLIVLAGLPEEHQGIAATFRELHPTAEPWPTLGLACLLLGDGVAARHQLRVLTADGPSFRSGLLRLSGSGPYFERTLRLADAVWPALHGYDAWPGTPHRVTCAPPPAGLAGWLTTRQPARAARALAADVPALVLLISDDRTVGLARCMALADAAGRPVVAAEIDGSDAAELDLLALHATVRGAVPLAVVDDRPGPVPLASYTHPGALLVCAPPGAVRSASDRAVIPLAADPVSTDDQQLAWLSAIPTLDRATSQALATRHRLDPAVTAQFGLDLQGEAPTRIDVAALIRSRLAVTLPPGVRLTTPHVGWDEIVLPADGAAQLTDAVTRLDHQQQVLNEWGLRQRAHALHGARLLLSGPPGTGKSLAAKAVATAAGTDLLVVDVSRIVSKWLGETEKNLAAAFEAAERTQAVLMLDEADALFATRTEISDAHDRYANLETAYLLARLDSFEGLTILTTNLRANIDPAFLRRIDYVVDFPLPDVQSRRELWQRHLPPAVLADDVDIDALGGLYPVPGAWIRNVSVAGAFAAAADGGVLTQEHLVNAMRREYAKASLPFPGVPPRRRHEPAC